MAIQFDHTIIKLNKDGEIVPSNTLYKGEKLQTGETYNEVLKRIKETGETVGFAHISEDEVEILDGATLDPTGTSTISINEYDAVEQKQAEIEEQREAYIAESVAVNQLGTDPVTPDDKSLPRPSDHDDKEAWYAYAKSKGFDGDYEKTTKKTFIETYGN